MVGVCALGRGVCDTATIFFEDIFVGRRGHDTRKPGRLRSGQKNDSLPVSSPNWQCPWNLYNFQSLDWDVKVREKRAHLEKGSLIFLSKHINCKTRKIEFDF